jgi:hypothetical protein
MSDNIQNQNSFLEHIADEEHVSLLREQETQETQESPSYCELVSQEKYEKFTYSHPDDTLDLKYCAAENYVKNGKSLPVVFAMAIGHNNIKKLTDAAPFTTTKQKIHTQVFKPPNSVLAKEVVRRAHFIYHDKTYNKKEDNPLYNPKKKNYDA